MARMYSRKRGVAGSKRTNIKKAEWVDEKKSSVERIIIKLKKEGNASAKIGLVLRDVHGIPCVRDICGKKISKILKENKLEGDLPEDMYTLLKKVVLIKKHIIANKHDKYAKRGLAITESKIRRLVKYYKRKKVLPADWKYKQDKVGILIE
ncbi:MAG: 30S ribosomal protein S15 [Candidatus Aenigmarchaeota archaeon]|nr:30S ribosomal protein S15 [Candidatus Aenigmarchaeota archaeon]